MKTPQRGFYYHNKHDPEGSFENYAYEVLGVAFHTEDEIPMVVYRPLYEDTFLGEKDFYVRPLKIFMDEGRFTEITDLKLIEALEGIRDRKYSA